MLNKLFFLGFDFLSAKQKNFIDKNATFYNFLLFISSMFEYEGFPESINTDFIEFYNALTPMGCCGVFRDDAGIEILGYCSEGGLLDAYGQPVKFNINTLGKENKQGVINGLNAAICWNNKLHVGDLPMLMKFTELSNLCDTAQKCLLRYARLFPVYEVDNEQIKQQLDTALKNADRGEPFTYVSKGLSKIGADGEPNLKISHLGDISAVDKLQYLSTYHNDLLRRFFTLYGMTYSQSMKQAQQSIEEIHSDTNVSWIIPDDRLKQRKKFVDTYNKVFSHNASVKYSEAWLKAFTQWRNEANEKEVADSEPFVQ